VPYDHAPSVWGRVFSATGVSPVVSSGRPLDGVCRVRYKRKVRIIMELVRIIKDGGVVLLPTDTIYGISASVYDAKAVERVYELKRRDVGVPLIVLISELDDLKSFGVSLDRKRQSLLQQNWPGKISFILPVGKGYKYISRGLGSVAFRMPDDEELLGLIRSTGPLVSTSANPSGQPPAHSVLEARQYFADRLDYYKDGGDVYSEPSTLVDMTGDVPIVRRQGSTAFRV